MKKHLINIINFLLLLGLLAGCTSEKNPENINESGYAIYEIGGGTLDMEVDINHQYNIKYTANCSYRTKISLPLCSKR